MNFAHRTFAAILIAGCSAVSCMASDPDSYDDVSVDEDEDALARRVCDTATEGTNMTLACPAGQVVKSVDFASYGKPRGTCGDFTRSTGCHARGSKNVVERACLGKASCSVRANDATFFGDPCSNVGGPKRLAVEVTCGR